MVDLATMLTRLRASLEQDPPRAAAADAGREGARRLMQRCPLVRRTVQSNRPTDEKNPTLEEIIASGRLRATPPCTQREIECGIDRVVYFFLGCGAFPDGSVAFLARASVLNSKRASYTPFDTGSLTHWSRPRDPSQSWEEPDKTRFLADHLGVGDDALEYSVEYVAAHFRSPPDYVRRPQRSEPDFDTYHGLTSVLTPPGDRRSWSIEVQLQEDLELNDGHIERIIVANQGLWLDLRGPLKGLAVVAEPEGSVVRAIHDYITIEQSA
jgi:hypothetical protein